MTGAAAQDGRIDWVDYAKGICIILVVVMHSTLGVEAATGRTGWMHAAVEFALPFRVPAFFLIAGLFLARTIDRDWRTYLDRKVVHFAYFYLLWMTIQFVVKTPGLTAAAGLPAAGQLYLLSLIEPFGTLWFIYLLPVFFVVTKLVRRVPVPVVWAVAAALEIAPIATGWTVIDEFAARFVYFYSGYAFAAAVFALAARAQAKPALTLAALGVWGLVTGVLAHQGYATLPFVPLLAGLAGVAAVAAIAALMSRHDAFRALRYCGRNSIVIYLSFFLPMAAMRALLIKTGWIADIGSISAIVSATAVVGAVAIYQAVRFTPLKFLFERPAMFWLVPETKKKQEPRLAMQPAE